MFGGRENLIEEHQGSVEEKLVFNIPEDLFDDLLEDGFFEGLMFVLFIFILAREKLSEESADGRILDVFQP